MSQYLFLVTNRQVRIFNIFGRAEEPLCVELYAKLGENTIQPGQKDFAHIFRWFQLTKPKSTATENIYITIFYQQDARAVANTLVYWLQQQGSCQIAEQATRTAIDMISCLQQIFWQDNVQKKNNVWQVEGDSYQCQACLSLTISAQKSQRNEREVDAQDIQDYLRKSKLSWELS